MKRRHRVAVAAAVAVAALSCSSAGLGQQGLECFGLAPTKVGTEGSDILVGGDGNDVILGLGGFDVLVGLGGDDALCGGAGSDGLQPGSGDDKVDGGEVELLVSNIVMFTASAQPVRVDLRAGTATGEGSDTLLNISTVEGTRFDDTLIGNDSPNYLYPASGNDTVVGGGGDDAVGFERGVTANLATGQATGEGTDTLESIESIFGSKFADTLVGTAGANYITGHEGRDVIDGGAGDDRVFGDEDDDRLLGGGGSDGVSGGTGKDRVVGGGGDDTVVGAAGDDTISGGAGRDVVTYVGAPRGVQVNLVAGAALGDGADSLAGVESVEGTERRDQVLGDARTNFLLGAAGRDTISAGAGDDFLDGGTGASSVVDGAGRDYCLRGGGANRCEVAGRPGRIPAIPDQPPAMLGSRWADHRPSSDQPPIRMRLPAGFVVPRAFIEHSRRAWLDSIGVWRLESPLPSFDSEAPPGTGAFRYKTPPSCFSAQRPYRTTVAPPSEVRPAVADGDYESVYWKGVLFRLGRGTPVRVEETPWLTGIVQAPNGPTGFPVWRNERTGASAPKTFPVDVQAGVYAWVGALRWKRTGGQAEDYIEPHLVRAEKAQIDKRCVFGAPSFRRRSLGSPGSVRGRATRPE